MSKIIAVAALSMMVLVGCKASGEVDTSSDVKKMSVDSKSGSCPSSCDKAK